MDHRQELGPMVLYSQWFPNLLAQVTSFMEDNFPQTGEMKMVLGMIQRRVQSKSFTHTEFTAGLMLLRESNATADLTGRIQEATHGDRV